MQKNCLCFLIPLLFILGESRVSAQERWTIGVSQQVHNTRLLINFANLQTKGAYRPTTNLYSEYNFGKKYAIHAGLGYTMMTQNSDAFKNNFHYLALPVYFKFGRIQEDKRFAFTSFFGTNLHYLINAEHVFLDDTKEDIMDQCRKIHFDLTYGAGIKYKLTDRLTLEALLSVSLGYMLNNYNTTYTEINNFNTGLMLNLSYNLK